MSLLLLGSPPLYLPLTQIFSLTEVGFFRWRVHPSTKVFILPRVSLLGKIFSPQSPQNVICVAMDWRQGPGRVNINNQSCRPRLFGLAGLSGSCD